MPNKRGVLAIGNFDSNVGYAWRLMESLWCSLAKVTASPDREMHVCFPSISTVPECLIEHGYQAHTLDFTDRSLPAIIKQLRFIRRHGIQLMYFTDAHTASFRYLVFRLAGVKKIIVHDHTPGVRTRPRWLKRWYKTVLNRMPLLSCTACFAVSPYVAERLHVVNCVPQKKIYCITNGIRVGAPLPPRTENHTLTIVTVARANYYKGIDFAIKVMHHLVHTAGISHLHYVLYGDGPNLDEFKALADQYKVMDYITFAGAVSDVPDRLLSCDIAFHPSRGEAMSLAILEYMRAGLPVVASDNPSVSSALVHDEFALLYPEGSVDQAARAIQRLVNDVDTRTRLGMEARRQLETEFSDTRMANRFVAALRSVAMG